MDLETQVALEDSAMRCLMHYNALSAWASRNGHGHMWHQVPKFHFLAHVALHSRIANPRLSWTYTDEAFMGIVKKIVESCVSGTSPTRIVSKLCKKWLLGTGHRMALQFDS